MKDGGEKTGGKVGHIDKGLPMITLERMTNYEISLLFTNDPKMVGRLRNKAMEIAERFKLDPEILALVLSEALTNVIENGLADFPSKLEAAKGDCGRVYIQITHFIDDQLARELATDVLSDTGNGKLIRLEGRPVPRGLSYDELLAAINPGGLGIPMIRDLGYGLDYMLYDNEHPSQLVTLLEHPKLTA